jgi:hypothetical protein
MVIEQALLLLVAAALWAAFDAQVSTIRVGFA